MQQPDEKPNIPEKQTFQLRTRLLEIVAEGRIGVVVVPVVVAVLGALAVVAYASL